MSGNKEIQQKIAEFIAEREALQNAVSGTDIYPGKETDKEAIQYYNNTEDGRTLLNSSAENLYAQYLNQIHGVSTNLCGVEYTDKQKALNLYEYMRFAGIYEHFFKEANENTITALSQSGLNVAIAGRGVCASQAEFMNDVLLYSGVENSTNVAVEGVTLRRWRV